MQLCSDSTILSKDTDLLPSLPHLLKTYISIYFCKKGVVTTPAHINAGVNPRPPLSHQYGTGTDKLTITPLNT